jgi:uncharacterized membrane protein
MPQVERTVPARPIVTAGILLGLGLGGFFDGIVLHQILQWHHMLSVDYPPDSLDNLRLNTLADGLFHAVTWLLTVAGILALWQARRMWPNGLPPSILIGAMLIGWGLFNLVEGVVDHHLLNIHHVRPGPNQLMWDLAFLVWGALMLIGGWLMVRRVPVIRRAR